ncbi:MAG: acyl carrier protein [Myxococcaceae bacterium]|nr:acyl carrier protein [Myxococcaceae bacterium]
MSDKRSLLAERVRTIVARQMKVDRERIGEDASFLDDLGGDSLSVVELVLTFEAQFKLKIPDSVAERLRTVADAVTYLEQHAA